MSLNGSINIVHSVKLTSSTKDSIHIKWDIDDQYTQHIHKFWVRYQALGSRIVQKSTDLESDRMDYDILQLHENTYYEICVHVVTNLSTTVDNRCIRASTATDSLSVALGSTFGAFLALGIIVLFVFIAKWQHTRKLKKQQLHQVTQGSDTYDSMAQHDADIEMSDVSLQVHEGTTPAVDISSSQSSQFSARQSMKRARERERNQALEVSCDGEIPEMPSGNGKNPVSNSHVTQAQVMMNGGHPDTAPIAINPPPPNLKTKRQQSLHKQHSVDRHRDSIRSTDQKQQQEAAQTKPQPIDYGGARPKNTAVGLDPVYANKPFLNATNANQDTSAGTALRPNLSCNW